MSSLSNVGNGQSFIATDQKDLSNENERFHEGNANSHDNNDSKDNRTIANKLASKSKEDSSVSVQGIEKQRLDQDATLPARAHGNEPSRGAKIDQELREEEEAYLRKKDGK